MDMDKFGVYALIFHTVHGDKYYIGSTSLSFKKRLDLHVSTLRRGKGCNTYLQNLYDKYGNPEFKIFVILEDRNIVTLVEQSIIEMMDPDELINFGPALPSPMFGNKHSLETKEKMSNAQKGAKNHMFGRSMHPNTRNAILKAILGRPVSKETRIKISQTQIGKSYSTKTREKMSQSHKGKPSPRKGTHLSPETRAKISDAHIGKPGHPHSIETRTKLSNSNKGRIPSQEARAKMSQSHKGKLASQETKQKMSLAARGKTRSLQHCENISKAQLKRWAKKKAVAE